MEISLLALYVVFYSFAIRATVMENSYVFGSCPELPPLDYSQQCDYSPASRALMCSGGISSTFKTGHSRVKSLTLCHWPDATFDPNTLMVMFPLLHELSITDGNVSRFTSDFPNIPLEVLNVSSLKLSYLDDTSFTELRSLRILDLRFNMLKDMESDTISQLPSLREVHLSGNPWNCSRNLIWLTQDNNNDTGYRVVDRDKMVCNNEIYRGRPVTSVMIFIQTMQNECPKDLPFNCTCNLSYVARLMTSDGLIPIITVDCSNSGLKTFPSHLPNHTTTLILSNNEISDLEPLVNNPDYRDVIDIYLDNNKVESVAMLEGSFWLMNFRLFSLKNNLLTHFPTYALDNALQKNRHATAIFLGNNPWLCDCYFTPSFQDLIGKYLSIFKDHNDIRCSSMDDDENSYLPILQLSLLSLCTSSSDYIFRPLDLVNGVLAFLIVLVFGKLGYDYWLFKRTGKLPWLVTKMP